MKTLGAIELAERLLALDPLLRISASDATALPYFTTEEPSAEQPTMLVSSAGGVGSYLTFENRLQNVQGDWHELEAKVSSSTRTIARLEFTS